MGFGWEVGGPIAQELLGESFSLSTSASGSVLMCYFLECLPGLPQTTALVDELLSHDAAGLCCQKVGHHVALSILHGGCDRHRGAIARTLLQDPQRYARHRFASKVVQQALLTCAARDVQ